MKTWGDVVMMLLLLLSTFLLGFSVGVALELYIGREDARRQVDRWVELAEKEKWVAHLIVEEQRRIKKGGPWKKR